MRKRSARLAELVRQHSLHAGVYARVAAAFGVDASYVSRVANGERKSALIEQGLVKELEKIERIA